MNCLNCSGVHEQDNNSGAMSPAITFRVVVDVKQFYFPTFCMC